MVECPECASPDVWPTTPEDGDGLCEYRCNTCGHYFVDEVMSDANSD